MNYCRYLYGTTLHTGGCCCGILTPNRGQFLSMRRRKRALHRNSGRKMTFGNARSLEGPAEMSKIESCTRPSARSLILRQQKRNTSIRTVNAHFEPLFHVPCSCALDSTSSIKETHPYRKEHLSFGRRNRGDSRKIPCCLNFLDEPRSKLS